MFVATDTRDWARVVACFTPEVLFDMSSLSGQPAARTAASDIASGWETGLAGIDAIHHQAGNYLVTLESDTAATAFCYATATHYRKEEGIRAFVGSYDVHLTRAGDQWLIDSFRFNVKYVA
ncbi:MAG TPA: nuclear transport factor 2 family protein [Thermoanaerobaculia bacterium]|nr:nuclear transport factor 2 family protein [Thermoanaerobaculia bacterium]